MYYPTTQHKDAAEAIVKHVSQWSEVEAIILMGSCARGKAARGSCLDLSVLIEPPLSADDRASLEHRWKEWAAQCDAIADLARVGRFTHVDLDFTDGDFRPVPRTWWIGDPDAFELEIGNTFIYTVPLYERSDYFRRFRDRWLPYYDDELRRERLVETRKFCLNNLDHIPSFIDRGLHFQAFRRLYDASRELLQALFIARRTYPIAYDKWIHEQLVDILDLPDVYREFVQFFEISAFKSREIEEKGEVVRRLLDEYAKE